jgi:type VI secretion system protein ImpA
MDRRRSQGGWSVPYEPVVNLEQLLAPIAGDNPAGANLLYQGLHDQIREARRADDLLAQGEWKHEPKVADWHQVVQLASEALASKTKDLQIGAWLTEALVSLHGFAGLHDGLALVRGLLERYWENLYPVIEDGDMDARANAIDMFNRPAFVTRVQQIPLTNRSSGFSYSYLDWKDSTKFIIPDNLEQLPYEERERALERKRTAEEEKRVTSEQWRAAQNSGNRAFYEDLFALVTKCWEECKALDGVMDQKFQRQTPGLSDLKKGLDEVRSLVEKTVKEKRILEPDAVPAGEGPAGEAAAGTLAGLPGTTGPIRSRQDALRRLAEVAQFFHATEPHSPVAYLLERGINWGNMSLDSWLDDVIKDPNVLTSLRETLGIKKTEG